MDVDYIQDSLAIHEGMPAGDKLRGFDSGRWRVEWHGGAATGWDGARAGQRGSLYFWHP